MFRQLADTAPLDDPSSRSETRETLGLSEKKSVSAPARVTIVTAQCFSAQ
jgi:hypothetical protein